MRTYYRLLILNIAVIALLILAKQLPILKHNRAVTLVAAVLCVLALPLANYAIMGKIARQRETSSLDLEIGLLASWTGGPFVTAMCTGLMIIAIIERDLGEVLTALGFWFIVRAAWTTVRKAEVEGWGKIDPNGPRSFSEALRS
jgi:hypothetical protein